MTRNALLLAIVVVSFAWFPRAYERYENGESNFNIYMEGPANVHWYYNDWLAGVFLAFDEGDAGFAVFYSLGVLAWLWIAKVNGPAGILVSYPILIGLEAGNVGPVLACACLWFPGAVLATLVKPYCVVFVVLHAYLGYHRYHARTRGLPGWDPLGSASQGQSHVSGDSVADLAGEK